MSPGQRLPPQSPELFKRKLIMQFEELENFVQTLPGAYVHYPFDQKDRYYRDVAVFYVGKKWFGMVNRELMDYINVKCDPERIPQLIEAYSAVRPAYHMNKKHWMSVFFDDDMPDGEHLRHSYDLVYARLTRREREELDFMSEFKQD